jgi:HD-like signal output (HDOD) protein
MPALPEIVGRLQAIVGDSDIDIEEVSDLMGGDPALVGKVLKVVNSAYYGLPRDVSNVKYAIGFIGLNEINRIMMSTAIAEALRVENKEEQHKLWFHSFHTALCATFLAKRNKVHNVVDELWSSALLHDVGKLVYLKYFPDHFTVLTNFTKENGVPFSSAEAELELPASAYLGSLLCDHWKLPIPVREACEAHTLASYFEADKSISFSVTTHLVCVGNLLACLSNDKLNEEYKKESSEVIKIALDYDQSRFVNLLVEAEDMKADAEAFMLQFG